MAIDTITVASAQITDGSVATADIADDAVTSAKLDTNISVDGNLGLGTSVSTRKLNVNAGSYGHMLLDTANAAHGIQILGQANAAANSGFDIQYAASTGLKVRTLAVQPLSLQTSASAGSPSDRLHIHTSGVVSIPQGIELGSGVDATAANVLDDYEEGTWTPTVGGNATYHGRAGKYTKVGRTVHASGFMQVNALGTGSNNTMSGFPFASSHAGGSNQNGSIGLYLYLAVNVLSLEMYYSNASTVTAFKGQTTAGGNSSGNLAIFGNNARIDFNITYETA